MVKKWSIKLHVTCILNDWHNLTHKLLPEQTFVKS